LIGRRRNVAARLAALRPGLTKELVRAAAAAVDGVANDSKLADLVRDTDDDIEWRTKSEDLNTRLAAAL